MQIHVDYIIFGSTNKSLCKDFFDMMKNEFEMSMTGELWYFLDLQIHQIKKHIHKPKQILQKDLKNIWNGKRKINFNSHKHFI